MDALTQNPLNGPVTTTTSAIATDIPDGAVFDGHSWVSDTDGDGLIDNIFDLF
jgi:hypothetical protein